MGYLVTVPHMDSGRQRAASCQLASSYVTVTALRFTLRTGNQAWEQGGYGKTVLSEVVPSGSQVVSWGGVWQVLPGSLLRTLQPLGAGPPRIVGLPRG